MTSATDIWLAPGWPATGAVRALASTRFGGVSTGPYESFNLATHVGDDPVAVAANRQRLAQRTGCEAVQWLAQVHGRDCFEASHRTVGAVPQADACWTRETGLALAVLTADCLPVVMARPGGDGAVEPLVGVAHAGWRGLIGGVLEALLGAMPCEPTELSVWLGPAIGPAAYQVGRDVYEAVLQLADGRALAAQVLREQAVGEGSTTSEVRYLFDLYQLARLLLLRQGVTEVLVSKACTASEPRFFSYRRDGVTGRMATVAWLPG